MVVAFEPVMSVFDPTSPTISLSATLKLRIRIAKAVITHQITYNSNYSISYVSLF